VEQPILDGESRGDAASTSDSEQPSTLAFGAARTSDDDSPGRAGLSIDELGDLSIDQAQTSKSISGKELAFPRHRTACGPRCPENKGHDEERAEQRTGGQAGNG
jgi:hypothetical protein